MPHIIQPAGYIVTSTASCYGLGATPETAWMEAVRNLAKAGISLVETEPEGWTSGYWILRSALSTHPATAAFLTELEAAGQDHEWFMVDGVWCTHDEAVAHGGGWACVEA